MYVYITREAVACYLSFKKIKNKKSRESYCYKILRGFNEVEWTIADGEFVVLINHTRLEKDTLENETQKNWYSLTNNRTLTFHKLFFSFFP